MRKFAKAVLFISLLIIPVSIAHAENASVLLSFYGKVTDPAAEQLKLERMQKTYEESVRDVSDRTMLNSAYSLEQAFESERLAKADTAIQELSDRLLELEASMQAQAGADVGTIMKLDAEYRQSTSLLLRMKEERQTLEDDAVLGTQDPNLASDKRKLEQLQADLEHQRKRVKELSEFAELGDVTGFTTPIGVPVRITSPFGERLDPITRDESTFHAGIDLEATTGTPVLAAFNGRVVKTGHDDELGLYVWIEHGNGIRTLYGHLSSITATKGQEVRQYEQIALSGNTGSRTTGEHLHFTVTINGIAVDPAAFVHAAS